MNWSYCRCTAWGLRGHNFFQSNAQKMSKFVSIFKVKTYTISRKTEATTKVHFFKRTCPKNCQKFSRWFQPCCFYNFLGETIFPSMFFKKMDFRSSLQNKHTTTNSLQMSLWTTNEIIRNYRLVKNSLILQKLGKTAVKYLLQNVIIWFYWSTLYSSNIFKAFKA